MKKLFGILILFLFLGGLSYAQVSFKIGGGLTYISGNEWNTGVDGWNRYINDSINPQGTLEKIHMGADFGGEVIFSLNRNFGIGAGVSYFQMSKSNHIQYAVIDWFSIKYNMTWTPKFSAVPIALNLYYTAPLGSKIHFRASLGAAYYLGRVDFENIYNVNGIVGTQTFTGKKNAAGFHGSVGVELALSRNLFLCLDVLGRFVKLNDISGMRYDSRLDEFVQASLWYVEDIRGGENYPKVTLYEDTPDTDAHTINVHKAALDLSGFSAKIGIRIAL